MAITNNGTKNSLPDSQIPSGYTRPSITPVSNPEYTRTLNLVIPKATVHNATSATTMTNIIGNATVGINKQVDDILAADYLGTATVSAYSELVSLKTNMQDVEGGSPALTDAATNYLATVILRVKAL